MPVTILVADDSATMRRVLEMTFAGEGDRVVTVENGAGALTKARELQPDIVLADATMDGMDGYEVSRAIKAELGTTPVVVMASQKRPFDQSKGKECAVDGHIVKPFDTQSVIDRVRQLAAAGSTDAVAATPAATAAPKPPPSTAVRARTATLAYAPGPPGPPPTPGARPAPPPPAAAATPPPTPSIRKPAPPSAAEAASAASANLAERLKALDLTAHQIQAVLALSREVVEQVVWEVVPDLAETIIREEIRRLTSG